MEESDSLLEEVESLRLADRSDVPVALSDAIQALHARLGRTKPVVAAPTLRAAHDLVFAVQQRLMAANPNNPRPQRHTSRPGGQPVVTVVRENRLWKLLTLPPQTGLDEQEWLELVEHTVERAWDRWCYAQQHAVRAAREQRRPELALAVARTAWSNYWELSQEAASLKERLVALASRPRPRPGNVPAQIR